MNTRRIGHEVIALLAISALTAWSGGGTWPQFRGPTGLGYTEETDLPVEWGGAEKRNVIWTSPLVGQGHASPIVWNDRIFICTANWPEGVNREKTIPEHHVLCYRVSDGTLMWDRQVSPGPWIRTDFRSGPGGGYAAATPTTDGELVYCMFGSSVIAALDFGGKIVWRKEITPYSFDVTAGSSLVLYRETVILLCAMAKREDSRLVAFKTVDGSIAWEQKMPTTGFAHSTPLVVPHGDEDQIVVVASGGGESADGIQSFDPTNGQRLWWCKGRGDASSPAFGSGILYADSGRGGHGVAVDPCGRGDVSNTHVKWTGPQLPESIGSPIIVGPLMYRLTGYKDVACWSIKDGKEVYEKPIEDVSTTWASPVADPHGRLYFANAGKSYVIQSGTEFKILAINDLGDGNHPSPAVANGKLFLVGMKNVYCIGRKETWENAGESRVRISDTATVDAAPLRQGEWECISTGVLEGLDRQGIKPAWPGKTADAGTTWRVIAPYPPSLKGEYNPRGWMMNFAWDHLGQVCYVARMGQGTWKYQY